MRWIIFLLILSKVFLFTNCANIGHIDGGLRDSVPPKIDSMHSSQSFLIHFHPDQTKKPIEFKFDEWVKIEDAFKLVVVSPPLQYPPKVELAGKGIRFTFDNREVLQDNTTYTINFGKAVKDLNEGNIVKNFRYVFSTGDHIDSAKISGKVLDAKTGEAKEDIVVMLYYSDSDTAIYKARPTYFGRTDKQGLFEIENIKDTSYKIAALEDANGNYLYDQDKENLAFIDRRVKAGEDTSTILLRYYKSYVKPKITFTNTDIPGLLKIQSNVPYELLTTHALTESITYHTLIDKDTMKIFYLPVTARDWLLQISIPDKILDTIKVNKQKKMRMDSFKLVTNLREINIAGPDQPIWMEWNQPIGRIDTTRIRMHDDTAGIDLPVKIRMGKQENEINIGCPCEESHGYTVTFIPGSIKRYDGENIPDTIKKRFRGFAPETSGLLTLSVQDLDTNMVYRIEFLSDAKVLRSDRIIKSPSVVEKYSMLIPSVYAVQIIEDTNDNGRWDIGDYRKKIQPEYIMLEKNISVRANWELKQEMIWHR